MGNTTKWFVRLNAFNLVRGCAFVIDDGEWAEDTVQVVQRVERVADTEKIVIFHRDLYYLTMDEHSAPGLPGREDVTVLEYSVPVLVFGIVVSPDDFNDNNIGLAD